MLFSVPYFSASVKISSSLTFSSYNSCTAYALSQKMRKSGAAGRSAAKRRTVSSEYVIPSGFENFGTHHMPLTDASDETSRSTSSISGPAGVIFTGIIFIPSDSQIPKCLSYPGDGHRNFISPARHHGSGEPSTPYSIARAIVSYIIFSEEFPPTSILVAGIPRRSEKRRFVSGSPSRMP